MKDFSLLAGDCETEVFTRFSEKVHATLYFRLCTSVQCTVVWKDEIADCVFTHFDLCLQPPRIEEFSVDTILKADTDDTVTKGVKQHGREHHAE